MRYGELSSRSSEIAAVLESLPKKLTPKEARTRRLKQKEKNVAANMEKARAARAAKRKASEGSIVPVIIRAARQADQVAALVDHCRRLDGTEIHVIDVEEIGLGYPQRNNRALWQAAQVFKGRPFFWLEPDAVPLHAGWLDEVTEVYAQCGKEILISSDQNPPFDFVGGIGVYGPKSHELFPEIIDRNEGFDAWMLRHLSEKIARHPIIQHSYARYLPKRDDHRFPRDLAMIRPRAAVFHRDAHQDIIAYMLSGGSLTEERLAA